MPKRKIVSSIGYRAGTALAIYIIASVVTGREWLALIVACCGFLLQGKQEYEAQNGQSIFGNQRDER